MEHEAKQDRGTTDAEEFEHEQASSERTDVPLPFANDGLELVRDSHC